MADVALTVDGRDTVVPEGTPLLDAIRALGIRLTTLCQLDGVSPREAWRATSYSPTAMTGATNTKPEMIASTSTQPPSRKASRLTK